MAKTRKTRKQTQRAGFSYVRGDRTGRTYSLEFVNLGPDGLDVIDLGGGLELAVRRSADRRVVAAVVAKCREITSKAGAR